MVLQLFVRGVDGRTQALRLAPSAAVGELKAALEASTGIPAPDQLLTWGGRVLRDERMTLAAAGLCPGATVNLLLRLAGGKGGFGALLRGQGRDGKITDNYDACRDLSGRRIRHVEAEKKLQQWQREGEDRELEALALKHVKDLARQAKRERAEEELNVAEVKRQHRAAAEAVTDAVHAALAAGLRKEKRQQQQQQQEGGGSEEAAAAGAGPSSSGGSGGGSGASSGSHAAAVAAAAAAAGSDGAQAGSSGGEAAGPSRAAAAPAAAPAPAAAAAAAAGGQGGQAAAAAAPAAAKARRTMLDLVEGGSEDDDSSGSGSGSDDE